ncbi:Vmr1p [Saccharomyces cerevisiae x Saccharomyces kudriavzevii VIN7]|uniref:Vmr1p n=1 Tax=Saccharomyces cerevisiae x Saccharomyces kudriavzevii (strain VIN7) TaxID=1095631 RepID=H0GVI7_SACCK|nr:Vmr1p [Saccharomyces cerevisiae x Saccharomyces kudriavzevii VIN7]
MAADPAIIRNNDSFWDTDDFTRFGRTQLLNNYFPLAIIVSIAIFETYHFVTSRNKKLTKSNLVNEYLYGLPEERDGSDERLIRSLHVHTQYVDVKEQGRFLQSRHFDVRDVDVKEFDSKHHGGLTFKETSTVDRLRKIFEVVLVSLQVVVLFLLKLTSFDTELANKDISILLLLWVLLLSLTGIRVYKHAKNHWKVCYASYTAIWLSTWLPVRSIYIGNINDVPSRIFYVFEFTITSILQLILITASIKDTSPIIYTRNGYVSPSKEHTSSILSLITWSWINDFISQAQKCTIKLKDVWGLSMENYSIFILKRFTKRNVIKNGLTLSLFEFFKWDLFIELLWVSVNSIVNLFPTILIKEVLEIVDNRGHSPSSINLAWLYVAAIFFCRLTVAICNSQGQFISDKICLRVRSILISEIYSKALRRKLFTSPKVNDDKDSASANLGTVINLISIDSFKVSEISNCIYTTVQAVIMILIVIVLLFKFLGLSALAGISIILVMFPLNFKLASLLGRCQELALRCTDERISRLNECLQNIRIVKYFAWENNISNDIKSSRQKELKFLFRKSLLWAVSSFLWFVTPTLVTSVTFAVYIFVQQQELNAPLAFTTLSLFTLLKTPLDQLSNMLSFMNQSKVSLERIVEFLNEEDTAKYNQLTVSPDKNKIKFKKATLVWNENDNDINKFRLCDLNINFRIGKLNLILGSTGSGKSALLMGLLGELYLLSGSIIVPGLEPRHDMIPDLNGLTNSFAYCSQSAWLLNGTLRNNVIFNGVYDENRYKNVIDACGLKRDLEILPAGDSTEIGEKGITLSGGQKQRISLARAIYSNAKHVLLDDCLSAVDSHTAIWIYENCITGLLMKNRTCILVTHNISLAIRKAYFAVILENGKVKSQGTITELKNKGVFKEDFGQLSYDDNNTEKNINRSEYFQEIAQRITGSTTEDTEVNIATNGQLIEEEQKSNGAVSLDVYKWYLGYFGGWKALTTLFILYFATQLLFISQAWWIKYWVNNTKMCIEPSSFSMEASLLSKGKTLGSSNPPKNGHTAVYYLSIYFLIGIIQALLGGTKTMATFLSGLQASKKIFNNMLDLVLHANIRFFDVTPVGRIMNRFAKDIEGVDQELIPYLEVTIFCLIQCLSIIFLITIITPRFLVVAVVVLFLYYFVGKCYLSAGRELKRIDSTTKSPIFQYFSETLAGVCTIRAFGDEKRFILENMDKIDQNNGAFFYLSVAVKWFAFRVDIIGAFIVLGSGSFILLNIGDIDSSLAGISLTYSILFTDGALWLVRLYSTFEMNMNSVERLKEYSGIEQENYNEEHIQALQNSLWPEHGKIEVDNLSLRYASNLPPVIKNVSFTVDPQMKIGIVGRTGAGKSTIITALFRLLKPVTGCIKIDGYDISKIDLVTLRRAITIIPQDPILFTGTIKSNLDPYDEYDERRIFKVLSQVNLISSRELEETLNREENFSGVHNRFLNLRTEIVEGGLNLSQGEKQLLFIARSLLRQPKIILLDEATSSIDYDSDHLIQGIIRNEFSRSTILTIAHRLRSVIDYDKVLVMDAGEVKEYDHPYELLKNERSIFYSMCRDSGDMELLKQIAKSSLK